MENTFYKFGKFLIDNAEQLNAKFENDRENGQLSRTPNVFKFAQFEFQRLNESKKITVNELKGLVKQIIKEEITKTTLNKGINGTKENPIKIKKLSDITSRNSSDFDDMKGRWYVTSDGGKYKFRYSSFDTIYYVQDENNKTVWKEKE
jgi:hypothetical protein